MTDDPPGEADLALVAEAAPDPDAGIPLMLAGKVLAVLEAMEQRLIALESAARPA